MCLYLLPISFFSCLNIYYLFIFINVCSIDEDGDGDGDGDDDDDDGGVGGCVRQPKKRSIISDGRQVNLLVRHSTVVYLLFSRVYLQAASVPRVHHANLTADTETSMHQRRDTTVIVQTLYERVQTEESIYTIPPQVELLAINADDPTDST